MSHSRGGRCANREWRLGLARAGLITAVVIIVFLFIVQTGRKLLGHPADDGGLLRDSFQVIKVLFEIGVVLIVGGILVVIGRFFNRVGSEPEYRYEVALGLVFWVAVIAAIVGIIYLAIWAFS
jgi:hypothetical protein